MEEAKLRSRSGSEEDEDLEYQGEEVRDEVEDDEAEHKEYSRIQELKKSKSSFMKDLVGKEKKDNKKKGRSREQQMKELIHHAEKYASFLLSKHKMNNQG
jgi:hypothetical protein